MKVSTTGPARTIHCPIEPETLLADIQGELPLDEARGVQVHIRTCERCQARAEQLRAAYEQVASLAEVPVVPLAEVRDGILRDSQNRLRTARLTHGLNLSGRGLLVALVGVTSAIILLIVLLSGTFLKTRLLSTQRSQNALSTVTPIGPGLFYAETVKLVPVKVNGITWDLGEVVAVDEHSGRVVRSLPSSGQSPFLPELGIGSGTNIHPALSPDGRTVIEAAIPADGHTPSAFAAIDAITGQVRYVTRLQLPSSATSQSDPIIEQLWISSDNATLFVLTDLAAGDSRAPRLLQFAMNSGKQQPQVVPPLDDTLVADMLSTAATTIAPDGSMLYNAGPATDGHGNAGINVNFVSIPNRRIDATLFIPGRSRLIGIAATPDGSQICLFNGLSTAVTFISTKTRAVTTSFTLASLGTPPTNGADLHGPENVSLVVSPDSKRLLIALDTPNNTPRSFHLWLVDVEQQELVAVTQFTQPVGSIALSSDGSTLLVLRPNGTAQTVSASAPTANLASWLSLEGNTAIIQLIGGYSPQGVITSLTPNPTLSPSPVAH